MPKRPVPQQPSPEPPVLEGVADAELIPTPLAEPQAGPTSVPGFEFCSVPQVERLLRVFQGGLIMVDAPLSPAMRLAFAAHQIRIGLAEALEGVAPAEKEPTASFLLDATRRLVNQISGASLQLDVIQPPPPGVDRSVN